MSIPISIQKKSLEYEKFQVNKLKFFLDEKLNSSLESINRDLLISKVENQIFNNISTEQITDTLILTAASLIEKDPVFDEVATQLLLYKIYREVFQEKINSQKLQKLYRKFFTNGLKIMIEKEERNADSRLLEFDLEKLSQALVLERDALFNYLGLEVIRGRYF